MKNFVKMFVFFSLVQFVALSAASAQSILNVTSNATMTSALAAAVNGDVINVAAGTYSAIGVSKEITIKGAGATTIIAGITITANNVTLKDLKATVAGTTGISSSGTLTNLALIGVTCDGNQTGALFLNVTGLTISGSTFTNNTGSGCILGTCTNVSIATSTFSSNGTASTFTGSGLDLNGVTTAVIEGIIASSNKRHGVAIGGTTTNIVIEGGTFSTNGSGPSDTQAQTGGGICLWTDGSTGNISGVSIQGNLTAKSNTLAGITITSLSSSHPIANVSIGQYGTVALSESGSSASASSGAGLIIQGSVSNVTATATFTRGTLAAAGVIVVGLNSSGTTSPSNITITGSTFSAAEYNATYPAITRETGTSPTNYRGTTNVLATNNNTLTAAMIHNGSLSGSIDITSTLRTAGSASAFGTAITSAAAGDTVSITSDFTTFSGITVSKAVFVVGNGHTITGTMNITSDNVKVSGLTISNIVVNGAYFNTVLKSVTVNGFTGVGATLTNCICPTLAGVTFTNNTLGGLSLVTCKAAVIGGVTSTSNGASAGVKASGIDLSGVTGVIVKDAVASSNYRHGVSISGASKCVMIYNGTFNSNGQAGNNAIGGGIGILSDASGGSVTMVDIEGAVSASTNKTAGIMLIASDATKSISTVKIGATGTITLTDNHSLSSGKVFGGGILLQGYLKNIFISNGVFTKGATNGSGIIVGGMTTDATSLADDPTNVIILGNTFNVGYVTLTDPAITKDFGPNATTRYLAGTVVSGYLNYFPLVVNAKALLQGPYNTGTGLMSTSINGILPLAHPYSGAPWNVTASSVASIPSATIVDWILVEIRTGTTTATMMNVKPAFLNSDGTVLDVSGTAGVVMAKNLVPVGLSADGNYYVVVRHRNHLAIMSAAAVALPVAAGYDFTTALTKAYGVGVPMSDLKANGTVFGMWAGDANASTIVTAADAQMAMNAVNAIDYNAADLNLSGIVTASDAQVAVINNNSTSLVP